MRARQRGTRWARSLALLALAVPWIALAADPAARFRTVDSPREITPVVKPLLLDGGARVQVMVRLAAEPVALIRAQTPGRALTAARRAEVVGGLSRDHDAVATAVAAHGGRVLAHLYDAWNGLRVEVPRGAVAELARLPGVRSVSPVRVFRRDNSRGVPFIGAPAVWGGVPGLTGAGVKVGIIDSGIDYTHADFGGPGTPTAFRAAAAASAAPADPAFFGPAAPKVKGGIDLVGDAYDADDPKSVPAPDPNPLDCGGHGTHVAGTIGGFGVTPDGGTYRGPYDATTPTRPFRIGPGVAPAVELYAIRIFGCDGTTSVVTEAIDWAVKNGMQVINMSLGSPFGDPESADAQAADAAAQAGVVVIASSGNSGPEPYLTGSPGAAAGALSVAAVDSFVEFPGATLALDTGLTLTAIDANDAPLPPGPLPVVVLRDGAGEVSLGCQEAEYVDGQIAGKVVITARGTCARVDRATFGARHGAAAVVMINNADSLPVYEGPLPGVAVPFLGVSKADKARLLAAGAVVSFTAAITPNPTARQVASFSSAGARFYDAALKPDVAAPGVQIYSAGVGTGSGGATMSGTSMAAPHATGVAALTVQAHPGWKADALRAAIENTADPALTAGYDVRLLGAGLVQPERATRTQLVAFSPDGGDGRRRAAIDFGFAEFKKDYRASRMLVIQNLSGEPVTVALSAAASAGAAHAVTLSASRLRIPAGEDRLVTVKLAVPAATVGDTAALRQAAGAVVVTPEDGANHGIALRVPYLLVARARASVSAALSAKLGPRRTATTVVVKNAGSLVPGTADFYEWGLESGVDGVGAVDLKAAGVRSEPYDASDRLLVFALATWERWSSAAPHEFDVYLDLDGDGKPDRAVFALDNGALTEGVYDGQVAAAVHDYRTGATKVRFFAAAPSDGSTLLLPALASDLGLSAAHPRFRYTAAAYDGQTGAEDAFAGEATFDAWAGAVVLPPPVELAPGGSTSAPLTLNPATLAAAPPLGLMVVRQENPSGQDQVQLIPLP